MSISEPFIKRPIGTSLLAVAILIAGFAAYRLLAIAPLPRVDLPTINVSAALPGASPETMAASVATPLERRFGRIAGVNEITSTSSLGSTSITLQFDLERDVDGAARDVQAAINAAGGELPTNLPTLPKFQKINPADSPIMIVTLTSDTLKLPQVFESANAILAQKVAQVPGVGQVFIGGGQQPAVRVQVDPMLIAGLGLSLEDVRNALANSTADSAKGGLEGVQQAQVLSANDQLFNADDFSKVIVRSDQNAIVRIRDIANTFDDVENGRVAGWANNHRSVMMIIRRQPGANILDVIERVRKLLPRMAESISPAIKMEVAIDRTATIRGAVEDVEKTLVLSVVLVIGVVFVFLRSVRATVVPSVAVPLSLVGTFGVMWILGYSLDNLSLMALTISTGFVVDDAIVVTENISRLLVAGKSPREAAIEGARQIGFTIVSITVSLLAVFIPILLMAGVVGRLFREFAVTLSIAIAISAVVSLTLTPMMCSVLLREEKHEERTGIDKLLERGFNGLQNGYAAVLRQVLNHRTLMGLLTLGTLGLTVYLYIIIPKGLFPQQDTGLLSGFTDAPQDISFPAMRDAQEAINKVVQTDPDVDHVISFMGAGGRGAGNTGSIFISLKPFDKRTSTADEVITRLRPKLAKVPGITLYLQSVQDVSLGGRSTRTQYQYALQDANLDELLTWTPKMIEALKKIPQLKDVASDVQTAGLQYGLTIDRDSASKLGVSASLIDNTLYDAFGQRQVATTYSALNQYHVVLEVVPEAQRNPDALKQIYMGAADGSQVPLSAVTKASSSLTSLSVNHQGQFPAATLSFNLAPGASLSQAVEAVHKAELQIGLPASVRGSFAGTAQAFQASAASEPLLIAMALFAVYIVLGILYESYIHPITILSTLPSAGVGALLALMMTHTELNVIALIGILLLIGIVKKNAIMMIDFALELERDHHKSPEASIYEACVMRFRPILMTTLAALFGGLPLALGHGAGAELRRPLGITIVGGLIVSQMLTLFTTPVIYLALDRFTTKKKRFPIRPSHPSHPVAAPAPAE